MVYLKGWEETKDKHGNVVYFNPQIVYRYETVFDKTKKLSA